MRSMTGFGKASLKDKLYQIEFDVEISSINRKNLDIRISLPPELTGYDPLIRKLIAKKLARGCVTVKLSISMASTVFSGDCIKINKHLIRTLETQIENFQCINILRKEISIGELLNIPGAIEISAPDLYVRETEETLKSCVNLALDRLVKMQTEEGENLRRDISKRIEKLLKVLNEIRPIAKIIPDIKKQALVERLEKAGLPVDTTDEHILKEILIFLDKCDISEEITRMESHIFQFKKFLNGSQNIMQNKNISNNSNPENTNISHSNKNDEQESSSIQTNEAIGRSMDFLIQEMFREITTLGNKAVHKDISPLVVLFKSELEKIREQAQNIM